MKSLEEIIDDAPKTLSKEYLQTLNLALYSHKLDSNATNIEALVNSLVLLVIDPEAPSPSRHLASVILQKMSPLKGVSEIFGIELDIGLINALPVILVQDLSDSDLQELIKKLTWNLVNSSWPPLKYQWQILSLISAVATSTNCPLTQDELKKVCMLLSEWLILRTVTNMNRSLGFRKSSSSLSIADIDGSSSNEFFTVLNHVSALTPEIMRNIQTFSMLRSFLRSSCETDAKFASSQKQTFIASSACDELLISIREYCMQVIDQVDRRVTSESVAQFQKACLVEAINLFNIICLVDSGVVHSLFPIVKRIYDQIHSNTKEPEAQDIVVMTSAMQFFINHGSSVMHKADTLYVYLFCDLLSSCYKDNYITYEILQLMKGNLSQLCYHSSILEKYFPTFLKVLAWRPTTYLEDFLEILPAFLSQHTSLEVFHSLIDLPCLTALLVLSDSNKSGSPDSWILKETSLIEALKSPELSSCIKIMTRKASSASNDYLSVHPLHLPLTVLSTHSRVTYCAESVIPLLKRYFEVILQYADMNVTSLLVSAIIERLSLIFPVPNYANKVHLVLSEALLNLFQLHPEIIFHCHKSIINYISHFKNYFITEQGFINMVWIIGEYVSVEYSNTCCPEVLASFFESLEITVYEALPALHESATEKFLKFLSVSLTTLSKLAARNQDQVPRAVLCLSKAQQQLSSFGCDYKKNWKIVIERTSELLSILNSPSVAAIILSPPKKIEQGRLHRDATSLPYILKAISETVGNSN